MRQHLRIGAAELALARASEVLALDSRALSGGVTLQSAAPVAAVLGGQDPSAVHVGILQVDGPLAQRAVEGLCGYVDGYDAIATRLESLLESGVDAVLLVVDSPGGDVAGLEAAVSRMRRARDAAGVPVAVYVDELAASAAYWIASAVADAGIYMPEAAQVGSIGCIGTLIDQTRALEAEGLRVTLVRRPAGKAEAHPAGPVAGLAEERMAQRVEACSTRFYAAVGAARGLGVDVVEALDGAVLVGADAVRAGLADAVVDGMSDVVGVVAAEAARRKHMREMRERLSLAVDASEADVVAAVGQLVAREAEARASLTAALERVAVVEASLAAAEAERSAARKEREAREDDERRGLVASLVRAGYETPATAWVDPLASTLTPRPMLASMPLAELRERVETLTRAPRAVVAGAAPSTTLGGLTAQELEQCKARGIDPAKLATLKAEMDSKTMAARSGVGA